MEKIKIISDFYFSEKEYNNIPKEIREIVESYKYSHCSGWYLHGYLEDDMATDIAYFYDMPNELLKESANWSTITGTRGELYTDTKTMVPHINGVYECEVYGTVEPCLGYFWTTEEREIDFGNGIVKPVWHQRGLVVFSNDGDANAYAMSKMSEKCDYL